MPGSRENRHCAAQAVTGDARRRHRNYLTPEEAISLSAGAYERASLIAHYLKITSPSPRY